MSVVTNVIMVTLPGDTEGWKELPLLGQLRQVDGMAGGSKCMECDVFMAAYNYLDHDEILSEFRSVKWESEEEAQIMMKGQEDESFTIYFANTENTQSEE